MWLGRLMNGAGWQKGSGPPWAGRRAAFAAIMPTARATQALTFHHVPARPTTSVKGRQTLNPNRYPYIYFHGPPWVARPSRARA